MWVPRRYLGLPVLSGGAAFAAEFVRSRTGRCRPDEGRHPASGPRAPSDADRLRFGPAAVHPRGARGRSDGGRRAGHGG